MNQSDLFFSSTHLWKFKFLLTLVDSFRAVSGALVLSFAGFVLIKKYSSNQEDLSNAEHLIPGDQSEDDDDSKNLRNDAMTEKLLKMSGLKTCDWICQELYF